MNGPGTGGPGAGVPDRDPEAGGEPDEGPPIRRVGRPARIDRDAIAQAVLEIGLERASMKAVAQHLGVSVPGLYHHVRNRKELLLLAAERSMSQLRPPEDRGQQWWEWLREWGRYSREALVEDQELFSQYLSGGLRWDLMVDVIDSVVQVLTRQGFTPTEALSAFDAAGRCAVGAVADHFRSRGAAEAGCPRSAELHRILAGRRPAELPGVRSVLQAPLPDIETEFEEELTALLVGMAVRRGEPWEPIVDAQLPSGIDR